MAGNDTTRWVIGLRAQEAAEAEAKAREIEAKATTRAVPGRASVPAPACHTLDGQDCTCSLVGKPLVRCNRCFQHPGPAIERELSRYQVKDKNRGSFGTVFVRVEATCPKCGWITDTVQILPH